MNRKSSDTTQLKFIKDVVVTKLWNNQFSWPFQKPVKADWPDLSDYYDAVLQPIDLSKIKNKLNKNGYISAKEAIADILLMLLNCFMYNNHEHDVVAMARQLLQILTAELEKMPKPETVFETPLSIKRETVRYQRTASPSILPECSVVAIPHGIMNGYGLGEPLLLPPPLPQCTENLTQPHRRDFTVSKPKRSKPEVKNFWLFGPYFFA